MCPLSGRESGGARPCDGTISRQPYRHMITTASSRIRPELASPAGLTATCAGLQAVGSRCAGSDCIGDQATWPVYIHTLRPRAEMRAHAADRGELRQPGKRWQADHGDHSAAAKVPLRCLRPARARKAVSAASAAVTRAPLVEVLRPGADQGSGTIRRLRQMPLAPWWRTTSAANNWIAVLPGERAPACASAR
jgi:hypothetical protein